MNKMKILVVASGLMIVLVGVWMLLADDIESPLSERVSGNIPAFLVADFPDADWSDYDDSVSRMLNGGPGKDGIPAIDNPQFKPIREFSQGDELEAIVVEIDQEVRVYPYNILIWHEIVNDSIGDSDFSVTFCPLCGSAIVFDRQLEGDAVTSFGVSGALLESNMVMYDREDEGLWLQSTGVSLAGPRRGERLELLQFQLLTVGEAKQAHPDAVILSEDTGYSRNYANNPYAGYGDSDRLFFEVSEHDRSYPSKDIFVAFRVDGQPVASPWTVLENGESYETVVNDRVVTLDKDDNQLVVRDSDGSVIPFYFEMWFSWAVQHQDDGIVFDPS